MSKNVFANGREISAKKDGNKSICAMPDVCLSPPSPPAGPIPIPYPNTAKASDTTSGSKKVKIGGSEIGLKNKSTYKKSMGDEAATKSFGMGVVSHNIQGPMKHTAWSMDVKVEGKNVTRHMDLTLHNHSNPPQPAAVLNQAKQKIESGEELTCPELDALNQDARNNELEEGANEEPFTLTTASRTDSAGNTKFMKAATQQDIVKESKSDGYQKPVNKSRKNRACTREKHNPQAKNHTEPKLIEPEWKKGGSIKMKIFHQFESDGTLKNNSMPCGGCKKMVCAAEKCGLKVILCNDKNEEVKAEDLCENGKPKPVDGTGADKNAMWGESGLA